MKRWALIGLFAISGNAQAQTMPGTAPGSLATMSGLLTTTYGEMPTNAATWLGSSVTPTMNRERAVRIRAVQERFPALEAETAGLSLDRAKRKYLIAEKKLRWERIRARETTGS